MFLRVTTSHFSGVVTMTWVEAISAWTAIPTEHGQVAAAGCVEPARDRESRWLNAGRGAHPRHLHVACKLVDDDAEVLEPS